MGGTLLLLKGIYVTRPGTHLASPEKIGKKRTILLYVFLNKSTLPWSLAYIEDPLFRPSNFYRGGVLEGPFYCQREFMLQDRKPIYLARMKLEKKAL